MVMRQFMRLERIDRDTSLKLTKQVESRQLYMCIGRVMIELGWYQDRIDSMICVVVVF